MDKKSSRPLAIPNAVYENQKIDTNIDMESPHPVTARWAIPRPSLATSSSSLASGGRTSRSTVPNGKSRGSASSQGSSSNHSTHSASSGSLLLSAANLAKVSNHHSPSRLPTPSGGNYESNLTVYVHSTASSPHPGKLPQPESQEQTDAIQNQNHSDPFWSHVKLASAKNQRKEQRDDESVASSTHFTVVNGFTRHGRSAKVEKQMWCCKSSHQITVLVLTMTVLFTAGILAAICYVEMRQRRDSDSRFS